MADINWANPRIVNLHVHTSVLRAADNKKKMHVYIVYPFCFVQFDIV